MLFAVSDSKLKNNAEKSVKTIHFSINHSVRCIYFDLHGETIANIRLNALNNLTFQYLYSRWKQKQWSSKRSCIESPAHVHIHKKQKSYMSLGTRLKYNIFRNFNSQPFMHVFRHSKTTYPQRLIAFLTNFVYFNSCII